MIEEAKERIAATDPRRLCEIDLAAADTFSELGSFESALEFYDACIQRDPDRVEAYLGRARALLRLERDQDAAQSLQAALEQDDRRVETHKVFCELYAFKEDVDSVLERWALVVSLDPGEDYNRYMHVGGVLGKLGRYEQAVEYYYRAANVRPWDYSAYLSLGELWRVRGDLVRARMAYGKAIAIGRFDYFDLGTYFERLGKTDDAIEAYRLGIDTRPQQRDAYISLFNLLAERSG